MTPVGAESKKICIRQADLGVPAVNGRQWGEVGRAGQSKFDQEISPICPFQRKIA